MVAFLSKWQESCEVKICRWKSLVNCWSTSLKINIIKFWQNLKDLNKIKWFKAYLDQMVKFLSKLKEFCEPKFCNLKI